MGFPVGLVAKNLPVGNAGSVSPWVRRIPWRRKWQPLQYSGLVNPIDRGDWQATVHKVAKSQT